MARFVYAITLLLLAIQGVYEIYLDIKQNEKPTSIGKISFYCATDYLTGIDCCLHEMVGIK